MRWAGVGLAVLGLALAVEPVWAQAAPPPAPLSPGLAELFTNPGEWLMKMFDAAVSKLGQKATGDVVGFLGWLLGSGNVISQTPAGLSYDNEAVKNLSGTMRTIANAGLAVVTVWGGVNLLVQPHIRAPYHGALELVPRVLLSGVMVNTSLDWGRFVIDLNNALCQVIGSSSIPGWSSVQHPPHAVSALMDLIAMAIYLIMGLLLLGQMLMRLALLDALLVIGPLALLCWVLPQTYGWARLWFSTFFGTVFVQSIQVLVLRLGADLIQRLPSVFSSLGTDPAENGRVWLVTLLLGMAVLQLARKIPRLMPGASVGGGSGGVAQIVALVRLANGLRGGK